MANNTTTVVADQATNTAGILPENILVIAAVGLITILASAGLYMYLSDKKYRYFSRASSWLTKKLGAEEDQRIDKEDFKEDVKETAEQEEEIERDPEELFKRFEAALENSEYIGRKEERRKKEKQDDMRDIVLVIAMMQGLHLLIYLWQNFA